MLRLRSGARISSRTLSSKGFNASLKTQFKHGQNNLNQVHACAFSVASEAQAIKWSKFGSAEEVLSLESETLSSLGPNDVQVKMLAAPLHVPLDLHKVGGLLTQTASNVAGSEGVGVVVNVGSSVKALAKDDLVLPTNGIGTWTTQLVASEDNLVTIPKNTPVEQAAVATLAPCTAFRILSDFVQLEKGDVIVQNNGDTIVGQAIVQIANKMGLKTVSLISDGPDYAERVEGLKALGADVVATSGLPRHQLEALLSDLPAPKLGVDGGDASDTPTVARLVGENSTIVSYAGDRMKGFSVPYSVLLQKGITVTGFTLDKWTANNSTAALQQMIDEVTSMNLSFWLESKKFSDFDQALSSSIENHSMPKAGHAARTTVMLMQ